MNKKLVILIAFVILIAVLIIALNFKSNETFTATVLKNTGTTILVEPVAGESELNSSDKISVTVPQKNGTLLNLSEFTAGSKVVITYGGEIMESYPAQIRASKIKLEN